MRARSSPSVASVHPDLAFDFALRNRERVEPLVDASSRSRFLPGLATGSADPAMIDKLERLCAAPHDAAVARAGRPRHRLDPRPRQGARAAAARHHAAGWKLKAGSAARPGGVAVEPGDQGGEDERRRRAEAKVAKPSPTSAIAAGSSVHRDDSGEGDVEQAVADDQAGREQHAHPLGELRDRFMRSARRS